MQNFKQVDAHIDTIQAGDLIFHNGQPRTVCLKDIKKCWLLGTSIFGDSYFNGCKPVKQLIYIKP